MTTAVGPTSFNHMPLKRLFGLVNGGTPPADEMYWGGGVIWVTPADLASMDGCSISVSGRTLTTEGLTAGSRHVPKGSIVISTRAPIGYVVLAAEDLSTNQGCRALVPRSGVSSRFFQYVLLVARPSLQAFGNGTTFMEISGSALGSLVVPVPPLQEQRRVVAFLDAETARIDELIEEQRRLVGLIEEHRFVAASAVLGSHVGGEAGNLTTALSGVPNSWKVTPLRFIADIQSGITLGKRYQGELEERPYLRVANVLDGTVDLNEVTTIEVPQDVAQRHELRFGDVLMTEGGDNDKLGRGTVWEEQVPSCLHQNHVFAVRPRSEVLMPRFLAAVMGSAWGRAYFTATAHQTTNLASTNRSKLGRFLIPLPSVEEQDRLLAELNYLFDRLDDMANAARDQVALLREHRQALITMAVTGGLEAVGRTA
ncbi:MAG: restriction endonuclease subunit S [Acidimicrobiia bacterium]